MCNAGYREARYETFGVSPIPIAIGMRPALLMLGAAGALSASGQKTFLLNLYRLNRHSSLPSQRHGTRCAWPGWRGPAFSGKRLFTHNVKL
jgi:hypothetical protein